MTAWKEKKLSEIADIIAGYAFKGSDFSDEGDEIVIKIKDIQEPFITIQGATKVFIKNYSLSRLEKFKIQNGDFALAMTGATIGKIGKYIDSVHAYINQRVAKFEAKEGSDKNFIYYLTQHPNFKSHILNNIDSQSAQGNISATSIGRYQVRIPDVGTQKLIAHIPQSLDSKIINNRITNETLEAIAQAIFKSWFVDFDPVHAKVNALKNGGDEDEARLAAMQAISGKSTEEMAALKDSDPEAYASLATTADAFPSAFTDSPSAPSLKAGR